MLKKAYTYVDVCATHSVIDHGLLQAMPYMYIDYTVSMSMSVSIINLYSASPPKPLMRWIR